LPIVPNYSRSTLSRHRATPLEDFTVNRLAPLRLAPILACATALLLPLKAAPSINAVPSANLVAVSSQPRLRVLHRFDGGRDGVVPLMEGLVADKTGALYGTTVWGGGGPTCGGRGCGTVFKLTPTGSGFTESVLHRLTGDPDGANPIGALVMDAAGALYGTTSGGGSGRGAVFRLTPTESGYVESVLYRFKGGSGDGSGPSAALVMDSSGVLYGTTRYGGSERCLQRCGTVFKLSPTASGYAEAILYRFHGARDGAHPYASLILDGSGALYGTTSSGGGFGSQCVARCGTVFRLEPAGSQYTETVIHRFTGNDDGESPTGSLIFDAGGALYGTTETGTGTTSLGTVFKLTPKGSGYFEVLPHVFQPKTDGFGPTGGLIADKHGALYGTTYWGGARQGGIIFKLTPSASGYRERIVWNFAFGGRGGHPDGGLIADATGALYGTTPFGGHSLPECPGSCGTVFKLIP
jgi:uncharacterized repeat protein (TIGR03803 family)